MSRRAWWIAGGVFAVALVALLVVWRGRTPDAAGEDPTGAGDPAAAAAAAPVTADLYFPGEGGRLYGEPRQLPAREAPEAWIASLVEALLAGPTGTSLRAPLPDGVTLRQVFLAEDGTVYLDLVSADSGPPPPSGSEREMLAVYSLVDTVLGNSAVATRVVLLWNGQQPQTFAGHLNTAQPLAANRELIAGPGAAAPPAAPPPAAAAPPAADGG